MALSSERQREREPFRKSRKRVGKSNGALPPLLRPHSLIFRHSLLSFLRHTRRCDFNAGFRLNLFNDVIDYFSRYGYQFDSTVLESGDPHLNLPPPPRRRRHHRRRFFFPTK